jgi:hypothetical protein
MGVIQYVAWRRIRDQRWWPIAEASTEKEAWDELWLAAARDTVGSFDYTVLKVGLRPNC